MSLNKVYLSYLTTHPLTTKSATAAVLATLNESIATLITKIKSGESPRSRRLPSVTKKILQMLFYAALLATPASHVYYKLLTRFFRGKLSHKLKVLQILTSLVTISPLLSAGYISWISVINVNVSPEGSTKNLFQAYLAAIKDGLKANFWLAYRTSAIASTLAMSVAQAFVPPDLWVIFFNFVNFILGTYQNTKMKLRQINLQQLKKD